VKVSARQAQDSVKQGAASLRNKAKGAIEDAAADKPKRNGFLQALGIGQETMYNED